MRCDDKKCGCHGGGHDRAFVTGYGSYGRWYPGFFGAYGIEDQDHLSAQLTMATPGATAPVDAAAPAAPA